MKKQLLHISGGTAFNEYEKFLKHLKESNYDPFKEFPEAWTTKDNLQKSLGDNWTVLRPVMPNKQNAKYDEWKIWFERQLEFVEDGFVLTGLSLGAMFLARYLSENKISVKPSKIFMIAGAAKPEELDGEDGGDFYATLEELKNITEQAQTYLVHSKDDPVVPFDSLEIFAEYMTNATVLTYDDKGHFWYPECSELIGLIKK